MSKIWKPVEDGDLHSFLAVQDNGETVAVFVNDDYGYAEESLPDDLRLCRLVPDEGSVPVTYDQLILMQEAMLFAWEGFKLRPQYDQTAIRMQRLDNWIGEMLTQLKGGE